MNVLLLSAGYGTRLRELGQLLPKVLLPVQGRPLLGRWIEKVKRLDTSSIFVNASYKRQHIERFIHDFYPECRVLIEPEPKGSLNTLVDSHYADASDSKSDWLVIHADGYSQLDLQDFLTFCYQHPSTPCLAAFWATRSEDIGILGFNSDNETVASIRQKQAGLGAGWANAGVYFFPSCFLDQVTPPSSLGSDLVEDLIVPCIDSFRAFRSEAQYEDVGTPASFFSVNASPEFANFFEDVLSDG